VEELLVAIPRERVHYDQHGAKIAMSARRTPSTSRL
jgi:hypothetical protein